MTAATALPGFDEAYAAVRGTRLRYFVAGAGPPLVLVHGLGGAAANWIGIAPSLAERFRVLVPELPGHGCSTGLPALPNVNPLADRVAALVERAGRAPAVVVGHSLGGLVALRLALRRPELVRGLVLAAPAGIASATRRAKLSLTIVSVLRPARRLARYADVIAERPRLRAVVFGAAAASDPAWLSPEVVRGFLAPARLHTDTLSVAQALVVDDPRLDLARVACPTLVVCGARDRQIPVGDGFEYARRLHASLRVVSDCGHLLIGERPDACLDAIARFADELAGAQASRG